MTQKLFLSYSADFSDPNNFQPAGVPQSGDGVAILKAGPVATGTLPAGISIAIVTFSSNGIGSALTLQDATVPAGTKIQESTASDIPIPASLRFAGAFTNNGLIYLSGSTQLNAATPDVTFVNNGVYIRV